MLLALQPKILGDDSITYFLGFLCPQETLLLG